MQRLSGLRRRRRPIVQTKRMTPIAIECKSRERLADDQGRSRWLVQRFADTRVDLNKVIADGGMIAPRSQRQAGPAEMLQIIAPLGLLAPVAQGGIDARVTDPLDREQHQR